MKPLRDEKQTPLRMSGAPPPAPRLSVLLPTVRPWPEVAMPLAACLDQTFDGTFEVFVLDGHGAGLDCEPDAPVRWIRQPGATVFDLRAIGVTLARGDIVVFSEDHCIATGEWLARISAAHAATAAPILIGPVSNHRDSAIRAADRASFALTLGPFAPPMSTVPDWRLPVLTNVSLKRSAIPAEPPSPGWLEYVMLADAMKRGVIAIAGDAILEHRQNWGGVEVIGIHFQSGRSYGASIRDWSLHRRRGWWRNVIGLSRGLYRRTAAVFERDGAGARSSHADRWWLGVLVVANAIGQMVGALTGPGTSRRKLV